MTIATVLHDNRAAFVGVFAENLAGIGAEAAAFLRVGLLFRDQGDGAIESDGQDIVAIFQIRVSLAVLDVRAKAPNTGDDRLAVVRRQADFARQRQQPERPFEIDIVGCNALRNARALRLFDLGLFLTPLYLRRLHLLAELQIRPVTAAAQRDFKSRLRVFAEHFLALNAIRAGRDLPGKIALGIV